MKTVGTTEGENTVTAGTSELHPEEMLTAARQGTLDPRSRRDLMAHLTRCAACRMELALVNDIASEGRMQTRDGILLDEMVRRSLIEKTPRPLELRSGFGRSSSSLRRVALPALCVLLGGGVATGMWSVGRDSLRGPTIESLPVARQPVRHRSARPAASAPAPYLAPLNAEEEKDLEPRPAPTPVVVPAPATIRHHHARPSRPHVVAMAPAAPTVTAGDLFADANRARRSGDYSAAMAEYRKLSAQFPGSREEITGRMIVGELMLARHNPGEALKQFDSYLAASPTGTLAEEARVGRATALGALSRDGDERAAWQELLRKHPASVHAQRAKDRLNELR